MRPAFPLVVLLLALGACAGPRPAAVTTAGTPPVGTQPVDTRPVGTQPAGPAPAETPAVAGAAAPPAAGTDLASRNREAVAALSRGAEVEAERLLRGVPAAEAEAPGAEATWRLELLAKAVYRQDRYAEAETFLAQAQERYAAAGPERLGVARCQIATASCRYHRGDYAQADALLLAAWGTLGGPEADRAGVAAIGLVNRMAYLRSQICRQRGDYWQAGAVLAQLGERLLYTSGPETDWMALAVTTSLGNLAYEEGRFRDALDHHRRALRGFKDGGTSGQTDAAVALNGIGMACRRLGDLREAESVLLRARALTMATRPAGDQMIAFTTLSLAEVMLDQGRFAEAEPLLLGVLADLEQSPAIDAREYAGEACTGLGDLQRLQGRDAAAIPWYERAAAIYAATAPPGALAVEELAERHGRSLRALGRGAEADACTARAASIRALRAAALLPPRPAAAATTEVP